MEDYRFKLQKYTPGSKITCPSCGGKRCTVRYIDTEGKIKFPDDVCLCDHANSCGHHYPPRQYFADHPELKDEYFKESKDYYIPNVGTSSVPSSHSLSDSHATQTPARLPPSFIDSAMFSPSMGCYHIYSLFTFLASKFGAEETERIFRLYNVAISKRWGGATVFWRTDINGNLRAGKVMGYDPKTGHRIKEPFDHVNWVHSILKLPDFNMKLCLFGEHLLSQYPDKEVMLVED